MVDISKEFVELMKENAELRCSLQRRNRSLILMGCAFIVASYLYNKAATEKEETDGKA